jgi:hypothetical protein
MPPVRPWRRHAVRVVAVAVCLVAVLGMVGTVVAFIRVNQAQQAAQRQLLEIGQSFDQVAATLRTASDSAAHAATSVDDAKTSLGNASQSARSAATALDQTASMINFSIYGLQPLQGVDTTFREQATQLRTLATQLDQTGGSLDQNATDLRAISGDVETTATEVSTVSGQLKQFAGYGPGPSGLLQVTTGTHLLLGWSMVVHVLMLGVGVALYLLADEVGGRTHPQAGPRQSGSMPEESER